MDSPALLVAVVLVVLLLARPSDQPPDYAAGASLPPGPVQPTGFGDLPVRAWSARPAGSSSGGGRTGANGKAIEQTIGLAAGTVGGNALCGPACGLIGGVLGEQAAPTIANGASDLYRSTLGHLF